MFTVPGFEKHPADAQLLQVSAALRMVMLLPWSITQHRHNSVSSSSVWLNMPHEERAEEIYSYFEERLYHINKPPKNQKRESHCTNWEKGFRIRSRSTFRVVHLLNPCQEDASSTRWGSWLFVLWFSASQHHCAGFFFYGLSYILELLLLLFPNTGEHHSRHSTFQNFKFTSVGQKIASYSNLFCSIFLYP